MDRFERTDLPDLEESEFSRRQHIKWGLTALNLVVVLFLLVSAALLFLSVQGEGSTILGSRILLLEENGVPSLVMVRPDDKALDSKTRFLYTSPVGKYAVCEVVAVTDEAIQFLPEGEELTLSIPKDDPAYGGKVVLESAALGKLSAPIAKRADAIVLYLLIAGVLLLSLLLLVLFYVLHQSRKGALMASDEEFEDDDELLDEDEDDYEDDFVGAAPFPLDRVIITPGKNGAPETVRLPEYISSRLIEPPLPRELDLIIEKYSKPPPTVSVTDDVDSDEIVIRRNRTLPSTEQIVEGSGISAFAPPKQNFDKKLATARGGTLGQRPLAELSVSAAAATRLAAHRDYRHGAGPAVSPIGIGQTVAVKPPSAPTTSLRAPVSLATAKAKSAAERAQQAYAATPTAEEAARLLAEELHEAREVLAVDESKEAVPPPEKRPFFSLTKPIPIDAFLSPEELDSAATREKSQARDSDVDDEAIDMEKISAIMDSLYTGDIDKVEDSEAPTSPLGKLLSGRNKATSREALDEEEIEEAPLLPERKRGISFTEMLEQSSRAQSEQPLAQSPPTARSQAKPEQAKSGRIVLEPDDLEPEQAQPEQAQPEQAQPEQSEVRSEQEADMAELLARRERRRAARTQAVLPAAQASRMPLRPAQPEQAQPEQVEPEQAQPERTAAQSARAERLSRLERSSRSDRTQPDRTQPDRTRTTVRESAPTTQTTSPEEDAAASTDLLARLERSTRPARVGQPQNPVFDVRDDVPADFVAELPGPERRRAAARREREAGLIRGAQTAQPSPLDTRVTEPPSTVPGSEDELVSELIRDLWEKSEPQ